MESLESFRKTGPLANLATLLGGRAKPGGGNFMTLLYAELSMKSPRMLDGAGYPVLMLLEVDVRLFVHLMAFLAHPLLVLLVLFGLQSALVIEFDIPLRALLYAVFAVVFAILFHGPILSLHVLPLIGQESPSLFMFLRGFHKITRLVVLLFYSEFLV